MTELTIEGPFFDELQVGDVFESAPAITLTDGLAATHQSIVGERLRLALDQNLSRRVTGQAEPLASSSLVWDVAIGQSTTVTHFVKANLFYRGLAFHRFPVIGETLSTTTEVVGLRENSRKPDRAPTGLAALRITTTDQDGRVVLDFLRCAMLPLRDGAAATGHAADLDALVTGMQAPEPAVVLAGLDRGEFVASLPGGVGPDIEVGDSWRVVAGDVVTSAPELARLTTNIARVHHDSFEGMRLVYGGHTIGLVLTQCLRALPYLATVVAWDGCDHLGPVHEGDTITSSVAVEAVEGLDTGWRLVHLRATADARTGSDGDARPVLDWRFSAALP